MTYHAIVESSNHEGFSRIYHAGKGNKNKAQLEKIIENLFDDSQDPDCAHIFYEFISGIERIRNEVPHMGNIADHMYDFDV